MEGSGARKRKGFRLDAFLWACALPLGILCLVLETIALATARGVHGGLWMLPFGLSVMAAILLLARWRAGQALVLLAGAVCIPSLFLIFGRSTPGSPQSPRLGETPKTQP